MYISIQQLKDKGLTKSQVARNLEVARNTVAKFWDMNPDEYTQFLDSLEKRSKKLSRFQSEIVGWLNEYPDLSAAQVLDWLKEHYGDIKVAESTVRNYVRTIRKDYGIPKVSHSRDYEAVEELPMGRQMQVDFGETKLKNMQGDWARLWFITFVLSHSRYKFALWLDRPFTTADVIEAHEIAFAFYGGIPEEIVYDQDHLLLVSENHGDLILTSQFATYVRERNFHIYMCRKADPESKGKIENVVKYIKRNFARHRKFNNVDKLNEQCVAWLHRTGNAKIHETIKKIPTEVFAIEKAYLRPVLKKIKTSISSSITRTVRKDNTIWYEGNRYSLPYGTYNGTDKEVGLRVTEDEQLILYDLDTGEIFTEHKLCLDKKGELIRHSNHGRDRSKGIDAYMAHVVAQFSSIEQANAYLCEIRRRNRRYIRDQLQLIQKGINETNKEATERALAYCLKHDLYRATDFANAARHFHQLMPKGNDEPAPIEVQMLSHIDQQKLKTKPAIRDFSTYERILGGMP